MKQLDVKPQSYVKKLCCDRCGRQAEIGDTDCEFHEFCSIAYKAGYGSTFGDGNRVEIDLCQNCLKQTLGTWLRITDPAVGCKPSQHDAELPNEGRPIHSTLEEHSPVVVATSLPHLGLESGAIGTIVHVYDSGAAYEVEFFDKFGRTLGIETVAAQWVSAWVLK